MKEDGEEEVTYFTLITDVYFAGDTGCQWAEEVMAYVQKTAV